MLTRLIVLLIWLPLAGFAQSYPEPLSDTVSDYADLLDAETEARVAAVLQAARDETGVHIAVVTIERQADYGGTGRLADFATGWFNAWGIGDATRNDGILILVARGDREMRIALGDAYGPVWDGRAQRVIDTAMLPAFRNENYPKGIEDGVLSAVERLARPFAAKEEVTEDSGFPKPSVMPKLLGFLAFALVGLVIAWGAFRERISGFFRKCPSCGARGMHREKEVILEAGEDSDGTGISHLRCLSCGHDRRSDYTIPSHRKARQSSRSSSGFGGGRSSGGGASGKW